jgi:hypothetical protein
LKSRFPENKNRTMVRFPVAANDRCTGGISEACKARELIRIWIASDFQSSQ